jgi:hypothetical protein
MLQSAVDTVVACMAIRTSLSLGAGLSISLNWRRSDAPYCECRIAFTGPSYCDVPRRRAAGMRVVRGQLSDDVLGILAYTAEQRRADPVLVPQSNEAKAWGGGDDAAAVLGIAFGSEHRQLNPSEIRTEAGAPDNRTHVLEHAPIVEPRVPVRHAYRAADARQRGNDEGAAREADQRIAREQLAHQPATHPRVDGWAQHRPPQPVLDIAPKRPSGDGAGVAPRQPGGAARLGELQRDLGP